MRSPRPACRAMAAPGRRATDRRNGLDACRLPGIGWCRASRRTDCMCQSCVEIDKQVEHYRELLRSTRDQNEIERISRIIAKLYGDRVLLHQNPER